MVKVELIFLLKSEKPHYQKDSTKQTYLNCIKNNCGFSTFFMWENHSIDFLTHSKLLFQKIAMPHSCFILENDTETLNNLLGIIGEFPEFKWVENSTDYEKGMNTILKYSPEIVFVNVDRILQGYYDVYDYCREINKHLKKKPFYVAISSDERKAYQAIKNKFFDYLLKPGKELEIRKIVLQFLNTNDSFDDEMICLKSYKDYSLLNVKDILYLQADNNSTDFILMDNHKTSAYKTLKFFETTLPKNFLRVHNSFIVNQDHISRINFGKCKCYLDKDKIAIPFSKSYRHKLQPLQKLLSETAIDFN